MSENVSSKNSSIHLTPPPNLALLFNQFNKTSPEQNIDPENVANSRFFGIDEIQVLKLHDKKNSLSFFHVNACSLNKNFDDLEYLLKCTNKSFNIIAVTETRISKKTSLICNINLKTVLLNQLSQNPQQVEHFSIFLIVSHINHALTLT